MELRGRIDEVEGVDAQTLRVWLTANGTHSALVHHILPQQEATPNMFDASLSQPRQDTTNPHFHFYIKSKFNSVEAAKYNLKKFFKRLTKSDWSLRPCDADRVDEYLQYFFNTKHGNRPTLIYSFKDLSEHQARANEIAAAFTEVITDRKKKEEKTFYDIAMELADNMRSQGISTNEYILMTHEAIKIHRKYRKGFNLFALERTMTTAMGINEPEQVAFTMQRIMSTKFSLL